MILKCLGVGEISTPQHGVVFQHEFMLEEESKVNKDGGTLAMVLKIIKKQRMRDIEVGKHYKLDLTPYLIILKDRKDDNGKAGKDKSRKETRTSKTMDS